MRRSLKKIGIFGGSFDPPHLGHLIIAEMARRELLLDIVYFVPAFMPPHKLGNHQSTARDRLSMTRRAIREIPGLGISDVELKRRGISFTVDTVRAFRRRFPEAELHLIIGSDSLMQFHTWRSPQTILQESSLAVYRRPGWPRRRSRVPAEKITWLHGPVMRISSTEIRRRVQTGKPIEDMVRKNVTAFIARHGLYRPKER